MNNFVSFKREQSADDEWTRHNIYKMVRSLFVWIALSLLATSGEARLWRGGRERIANGSPQGEGNINEYMCKEYNRNCDCECVPLSQCINSTTSNIYGEGQTDIRIEDPRCESNLETCCKREDIRKVPAMSPAPSKGCGKRNLNGLRITGATNHETHFAEFPWMVAVLRRRQGIMYKMDDSSGYYCGGSLIHPQVVLTAAHRVQGMSNLVVRAGEWDTQTTTEPFPHQDIKVLQVIVHEQFDRGTAHNDVALLILERPVDMSLPNVGTICLPEANENMDNRNCVATGWGKDSFGQYQTILKKADLPIVEKSRCQEALRNAYISSFTIHESFVCAGGVSGEDTCQGDGGGPLACPSKNNPGVYVQAGVTSWSVDKDCGGETPGVYADVSHFVTWIHDKLNSQGFSI